MNRELLIKALSIAKPSLGAGDNVLPVLSHFCFMGDVVYAYNDITAIIVEVDTGLDCALHGDTLLGILAAVSIKDIDVEMKEFYAQLDVGTGKVKVPSLPSDSFLFELPDEETNVSIPLTADFGKALELCLQSIKADSTKMEFAGVTVRANKDGIVLFSTDNVTASKYVVGKYVGRKGCEVVIPTEGVNQLLKLIGSGADKLEIGEKVAIAACANGITLVTKLLPANGALFDKVFDGHLLSQPYIDVPVGFKEEIQKAVVLLSKDTTKDCFLTFDAGNQVLIEVSGQLGGMKTVLGFIGDAQGAVSANPDHIIRILPHASKMMVNSNQSLVFTGNNFTHIVSCKYGKVHQSDKPVKRNAAPAAAAPSARRPMIKSRAAPPPTSDNLDNFEDDIPF